MEGRALRLLRLVSGVATLQARVEEARDLPSDRLARRGNLAVAETGGGGEDGSTEAGREKV